jgi:hypothetical protein
MVSVVGVVMCQTRIRKLVRPIGGSSSRGIDGATNCESIEEVQALTGGDISIYLSPNAARHLMTKSASSRSVYQESAKTFPMPGDPLFPSLLPREITSLFFLDRPVSSNLARNDLAKLFSDPLRQSVERTG